MRVAGKSGVNCSTKYSRRASPAYGGDIVWEMGPESRLGTRLNHSSDLEAADKEFSTTSYEHIE